MTSSTTRAASVGSRPVLATIRSTISGSGGAGTTTIFRVRRANVQLPARFRAGSGPLFQNAAAVPRPAQVGRDRRPDPLRVPPVEHRAGSRGFLGGHGGGAVPLVNRT